jgi:hypothetical protein
MIQRQSETCNSHQLKMNTVSRGNIIIGKSELTICRSTWIGDTDYCLAWAPLDCVTFIQPPVDCFSVLSPGTFLAEAKNDATAFHTKDLRGLPK